MGRAPSRPTGSARRRVLDAALELFAQHGVSGTSLQMIADDIGVSKAAVYHQFPAKDDIARVLLGEVHDALASLVHQLEQRPPQQREGLAVAGVVALMVSQRQVMLALYRDPEMERLAAADVELEVLRNRLDRALNPDGAEGAVRRRLGWAVIGAGFTRAISDPQFANLSDDELTQELVELALLILGRSSRSTRQ